MRTQPLEGTLALLMMDVDYFKLYNDCGGLHTAGVDCLIQDRRDPVAIVEARNGPGTLRRRGEFALIAYDNPMVGRNSSARRSASLSQGWHCRTPFRPMARSPSASGAVLSARGRGGSRSN